MDATTRPPPTADRLQALAMLLPAGALLWPGPLAPLAGDLVPHLTGAGFAALLALPAAAIAAWRAAPGRPAGLWLALVALCLASARGEVLDPLERSRALLVGWTGLALLLAGAGLGPAGRRTLALGAAALSLLALLPAHLDAGGGLAGALGNTGSTSEAALAGAAAGAALAAFGSSRAGRALGLAALALHAGYALRVPVHAGVLSLAFALGALALRLRGAPHAARLALGLLAIALPLAALARGTLAGATPPAAAPAGIGATHASPGDAGGLAVRASLARASLELWRAHPWFGVGPGQFAAAFPPHREPGEIEVSTHGRALGAETEVEHPHDDWLLALVEGGLVGGALTAAFLALALLRALHGLASDEPARAALCAAAVALLANAFAHAVLSADAASSTLAHGALGVALSAGDDRRPRARPRLLLALAAVALALQAPRALALVRHGRELARLAGAAPPPLAEVAERALGAAPDSALARTLCARALGAGADAEAAWEDVLAVRPFRFEAWMQLGALAARRGELAAARARFERARSLDPGHPGLARNLATLALEEGRTEEGLAALASLPLDRAPSPEWLLDFAADLYLRGREAPADAVLARLAPELAPPSPELAHALARERAATSPRIADSLEARAQRTWAREHALAGRWRDAVRSYRQELRVSREHVEGGAAHVRFELAAALLASGDEAGARAALAGPAPAPGGFELASPWARERLSAAGLGPADG